MRFFCRHLSPPPPPPLLLPRRPLVGENGSLFPRFLCTDPRIIVRVGVGSRQRVEERRCKDTAILHEKSRTRLALYPPYTEKVFPTPRGAFDDDGGWRRRRGRWKREGVDLSCQTLAPHREGVGCPFASTTTTDAHPKVSNRDSGFWGSLPLCPPPSVFPPSLPSPFGATLLVLRPFTLALLSLSTLSTVLANLAGDDVTLHPCTFSHPRGVVLETQFRNLHICRPDALARGRRPGPYILTIFSERRERGRRTFRASWNSFSRTDLRTIARPARVIHPQVNQLSMGPSLSVPVPFARSRIP